MSIFIKEKKSQLGKMHGEYMHPGQTAITTGTLE